MIRVNLTELENQSKEYINMLTDNKGQVLRREMIKFLKEEYWQECSEYSIILEFINDFFVTNQPERSKREDFFGHKATVDSNGVITFENGEQYDLKRPIEDAVL